MTCGTAGNDWALSPGNDLLVEVYLDTANPTGPGRIPATGLTGLVAWLAPTRGGGRIGATEIELDELGSTGIYRGIIDSGVTDELLAGFGGSAWLAIELPGDLLIWYRVPVAQHRTGA